MLQIRQGVFETNSSSVHSLVMCTGKEMEEWMNGKLFFDRWKDKFVPATESLLAMDPVGRMDESICSYDEFWDYIEDCGYEGFEQTYKTSSGEVVHAFGYYGEDR